jgi:hypothetical protein
MRNRAFTLGIIGNEPICPSFCPNWSCQKLPFDLGECSCLALGVAVLVELLGGGDVGVAEDELGVAGRDAEVLQDGRGGVACVVDRDQRDLCSASQDVESTDEVARFDGCALITEEHQTLIVAAVFGDRFVQRLVAVTFGVDSGPRRNRAAVWHW